MKLVLSRSARASLACVLAIFAVGVLDVRPSFGVPGIIQITAPTINVSPGATGSFDIIESSNVSPVPLIGVNQVDLKLPVQSNVTFTGVSTPASNYIFGNSFNGALNQASNEAMITDFPTTPAALPATAGLLHVNYSVSASAAIGSYALTFITDYPTNLSATVLGDAQSNPLAVSVVTGSINVVPEPESFVLALVAGVALLAVCRRRRRVAGRSTI